MPVTPPRLDDLDYATIEKMLRGRIPLVAPEWTDHNDSDPGIAILQLCAFLAEQVGYRINRVPEKTYVEFMKLVGVRLRPTVAARTRMAFVLAKPERAEALFLPRGSRITAKGGQGTPPDFETDAGLDILPAQIAALVTARNGLTNINAAGETFPANGDAAAWVKERFSIAWDGKTPKLKDLPSQPVPLFFRPEEETHKTLYIALAFNPAPPAGFLGARATLHLQIDADELPEPQVSVQAGDVAVEIVNAVQSGPPAAEYAYYRPPGLGGGAGSWEPLQVIGDGTGGWQQSGAIRFEVPTKLGPIPAGSWTEFAPGKAHPLVGALKNPVEGAPADVPVMGWLRVRFAVAKKVAVRSLSFNTVEAVNLTSVTGERLGPGDGRPAQVFALGNANVEAAGLSVMSRDDTRPDPFETWRAVPDFDSAGPDEAVFVLDAEAGVLLFGDGVRGRPPRVSETMIAAFYRHGGGVGGNVATGSVSQPAGLPPAVAAAVNIMPARGGRDAETLDDAKQRTPAAFRARGRAVTAADFEEAACAAPGVRIARAAAVPLRRPYPEGHRIGGQFAPGIDLDTQAPGTVSVVVVPEADGPYPMPTATELGAVARHLDTVRLLTTEVHVATPQYVRLYDFQVAVRADPGYSETLLREAIGDHLRRRLHVLTGGPDGKGYPFGGVLHHADLVAEVFAVPGVALILDLACMVDGRTPDSAERAMRWRLERQMPLRLTNCARSAADILSVDLLADEVPFVDASTLAVRVVAQ
jgi:hypothetical protein